MRLRIIAMAIGAILMVAAVGQATVLVTPPVTEQLVEGHTAFTVLEAVRARSTAEETYAAAVAFLVRELSIKTEASRFPGVLWFNDQYLVDPSSASVTPLPVERYPCGAVIAVNAGDPVPINMSNGFPVVPADAVYVESYHVTPPTNSGNQAWNTDKWMWQGRPMWSVAVNNGNQNEARATSPDDGTSSCGSANSQTCNGNYIPITDDTPQEDPVWNEDPVYRDNRTQAILDHEGRSDCIGWAQSFSPTGDQRPRGYSYPCGGNGDPTCRALKFNALLYFFLDDLTVNDAPKNHTRGSTDYNNDVSGCQWDVPDKWPCPNDDDDREGNSHPYNPMKPSMIQDPVFDPQTQYPAGGIAEGRDNHGGSADCGGPDASNDTLCHRTNNIDLNYGYREAVLPPRIWRVYDAEGYTAPYYCQDGMTWCNEEDISSDL